MFIYEKNRKLQINMDGNLPVEVPDIQLSKDSTTGKTAINVDGTPSAGLPEGGNDGDVLTRVVDGGEKKVEWKAPAGGECDLYEHTTALFTRAVGSPLGMCVSYTSSNPEPLNSENFVQEIEKMFSPAHTVEVNFEGGRAKVAKFMLNGYAAWGYSSIDEVVMSLLHKTPLKYIAVYYIEPVDSEEDSFYAIGACAEADREIVDERFIPFSWFEGETEVTDMIRKL